MSEKMGKIKPRTLAGFIELLPADQVLFNKIYDKIRASYEKFGFTPLDTPILEYSDVLLAKAGGETEKQIYCFEKGDNNCKKYFRNHLIFFVVKYYWIKFEIFWMCQ